MESKAGFFSWLMRIQLLELKPCNLPMHPKLNSSPLNWLVVEPTHLKNMLVKMGSSSPNRGENKQIFETTT